MQSFLRQLAALLPSIERDVAVVAAAPPKKQWHLLYNSIIVHHLVHRHREFDPIALERAKILWFRLISVSSYTQRQPATHKIAVDMKQERDPPARSSSNAVDVAVRELFAQMLPTLNRADLVLSGFVNRAFIENLPPPV